MIRHFVGFQSYVGVLTNMRKVCADLHGAKAASTVRLCELVSQALDARSSGAIVRVPEDLRAELGQAYPCWWSGAGQQSASIQRYAPERATLQIAAALHRNVEAFSFGLPPIRLDPQLASLLEPDAEEDQLAVDRVRVYYSRKQQLVRELQSAGEMACRSAFDRRRRCGGSAGATSAAAFESMNRDAEAVFVSQVALAGRAEAGPRGGAAMAEQLKRRAAAWYRASWARRQRSSTILQIPTVLKYLVQLKMDASDADRLRSGLLPRAPLVLAEPAQFVVFRR